MTVNYDFNLENDDFLDDTFRSIPENVLNYSISSPASENLLSNVELKDFQAPDTCKFEFSSVNTIKTDQHRKKSLSFLFTNKEALPRNNKADYSEISNSSISINMDVTTKIDSRFVPGFTPKAKKRKLPGPAGFFLENNDNFQPADEHSAAEKTTTDIEIQNITNSQFSSEDLLLPSWQNLKTDVSSCQNLLSTAKYFSIRRVLHETSKKKLPKHLVVPVLCVLIKKFNADELSLVLIDDTGEISGKIDKELLDMYKDVFQEKTALVLKKVTCICNILILKKQNVVSIYLDGGSVKHVLDLNSILDKEEPLKPMNCQCPGTPDEKTIKKPLISKDYNSTPIPLNKTLNKCHKTSMKITSSLTKAKNLKENNHNIKATNISFCPELTNGEEKVLNLLESVLAVSKADRNSANFIPTNSPNQIPGESLKSVSNVKYNSASCSAEIKKHNLSSKISTHDRNCYNNSKPRQQSDTASKQSFAESNLEEDLFCEDTDDFDDILCSLDEKSFLKDI